MLNVHRHNKTTRYRIECAHHIHPKCTHTVTQLYATLLDNNTSNKTTRTAADLTTYKLFTVNLIYRIISIYKTGTCNRRISLGNVVNKLALIIN